MYGYITVQVLSQHHDEAYFHDCLIICRISLNELKDTQLKLTEFFFFKLRTICSIVNVVHVLVLSV
jgi:hypothetical protein